MLTFPQIDPVAFHILDWPVHWYGLAYVAGFLAGFQYIKWIAKQHTHPAITADTMEKAFTWLILAIIIGGRLGYVLFYNPSYYFSNPMDILKTWQGGMSFHGGLLGVILVTLLFCKREKINFFEFIDRITPAFPIGIFFGRLANFINGELYGRITEHPIGMIFPHGGPLPRHPSQLYEALLEGLILFIILHFIALKRVRKYELSGAFLFFYGIFRFFVEYARMPDEQYQTGIFEIITMGQILCLPMIILGTILIYASRKHVEK